VLEVPSLELDVKVEVGVEVVCSTPVLLVPEELAMVVELVVVLLVLEVVTSGELVPVVEGNITSQ
jgi:hypothetical protein